MKTINAINKLKKNGFEVQSAPSSNKYYATKQNNTISFIDNGGRASAVFINCYSNSIEDYNEGVHCDSVTQAIKVLR